MRPARPSCGSALRSRPRGPGTTYHKPTPRRGEAQAAALGVVAFGVKCTLPAHTSEGRGVVEKPRAAVARTGSHCPRYPFSDPQSFPHFCGWSSTPLGPDGVGRELYFPRRDAPVSLEAEKALSLEELEGGPLP